MCKSVIVNDELKAEKVSGYLLEPKYKGYSHKWESHHATNPCVVRFKEDERVFLGYRAGGAEDFYRNGKYDVWASHLGLAILDETGQKVDCRLPLPIMTTLRDIDLPKTEKEYEESRKKYSDKIIALHDFRFFNWNGYLHVIYHEATLEDCYDAVVRMPVQDFLERVDKSIQFAGEPVEKIIDQWNSLWWNDNVWEPCGFNGTNRIFPSSIHKGDVIFFELGDGTLQMCHRPLADATAVLNTGHNLFAQPTEDGLTEYGVYETCVRPGYTDNSHIGNNGSPTPANIDGVDVYIDIAHGCFDEMIANPDCADHDILYYPYFRVKDRYTGEVLYYSQEPVLDFDQTWRDHAEDGAWISQIEHLRGVMFPGGQIPVDEHKNGLDDEFITYLGLGDTAIGIATFTLRKLLPDKVIDDILVRKEHQNVNVYGIEPNIYRLPEKINGWQWQIENAPEKRNIIIVRKLDVDGFNEVHKRTIETVPGNFDADAVIWDGKSITYIDEVGWALIYKGVRWDEINNSRKSSISYGICVLDKDNPEKILYRSSEPIGSVYTADGWGISIENGELKADDKQATDNLEPTANMLNNVEKYIPDRVLNEIKRIHRLSPKGKVFVGQMITWQRHKSGILDRSVKLFYP